MSVECFLDTNILVYAASSAAEDATKRQRSLELIEGTDWGLSAQVLQEFYVAVTQKIRRPMRPQRALEILDEMRALPMAWPDYPMLVSGIEHSLRHRISFWDGAIVAAAEKLEAQILYSEDLNHGQQYGLVRVLNPFLGI
jgi:predicted nucleic acid-binding protein